MRFSGLNETNSSIGRVHISLHGIVQVAALAAEAENHRNDGEDLQKVLADVSTIKGETLNASEFSVDLGMLIGLASHHLCVQTKLINPLLNHTSVFFFFISVSSFVSLICAIRSAILYTANQAGAV